LPADEPSTRSIRRGGLDRAAISRAEDHVRLRACVDRLCDTQKAVVTWRLLDEQPGENVAEALGISRGYVDVLLHRAKIQLRACLTDDEPDA
jgi:RNA polymerase sigma-70 factor (ECF subfamily)